VFFVSNLHAKVYWAEGRGCIVGSANLSQNGLGEGGLHEVAVQLPPRSFDLNGFLRKLKRTPVTKAVIDAFDERCRLFRGRNHGRELLDGRKNKKGARAKTPTFAQWMAMDYQIPWSLEVADTFYSTKDEKEIVRRGVLSDEDVEFEVDYWSGTKGMTTPGRWVLFVEVTGKRRSVEGYWACAEEQMKCSRLGPRLCDDTSAWFAIQRSENKHFGPVPFSASEPRFQKALRRFLQTHKALDYHRACKLAPDGQLDMRHMKELLALYRQS
jgi:hypothetical protein